VLDSAKCNGCGTCVEQRCPVDAVTLKNYPEYNEERATIEPEACLGCGLCALTCPTEALRMKLVRPPDHIPKAGEAPYAVSPS